MRRRWKQKKEKQEETAKTFEKKKEKQSKKNISPSVINHPQVMQALSLDSRETDKKK